VKPSTDNTHEVLSHGNFLGTSRLLIIKLPVLHKISATCTKYLPQMRATLATQVADQVCIRPSGRCIFPGAPTHCPLISMDLRPPTSATCLPGQRPDAIHTEGGEGQKQKAGCSATRRVMDGDCPCTSRAGWCANFVMFKRGYGPRRLTVPDGQVTFASRQFGPHCPNLEYPKTSE
jgi:hypothetical protein